MLSFYTAKKSSACVKRKKVTQFSSLNKQWHETYLHSILYIPVQDDKTSFPQEKDWLG